MIKLVVQWWRELGICDQIKLAKTSRIEMENRERKRSEIVRYITAVMEREQNESVFSRAEDHYLNILRQTLITQIIRELLGNVSSQGGL